jgi:hypothetical protein
MVHALLKSDALPVKFIKETTIQDQAHVDIPRADADPIGIRST